MGSSLGARRCSCEALGGGGAVEWRSEVRRGARVSGGARLDGRGVGGRGGLKEAPRILGRRVCRDHGGDCGAAIAALRRGGGDGADARAPCDREREGGGTGMGCLREKRLGRGAGLGDAERWLRQRVRWAARVRRGAGTAWGSVGPGRLGLARDLGWVSREGWAGPGLSLGPVGFWSLLSFSTSNSN